MPIELSRQEMAEAHSSLKKYLGEELECEVGDLQTQMLLAFFLKEIAPHAYNRGVSDAERFFRAKVEDLSAVCYEVPMTYWTGKKRPQ